MRELELATMSLIRGGGPNDPGTNLVDTPPDVDGPVDIGGGWSLTQDGMNALLNEARTGTDQSVTDLGNDIYAQAQGGNPFNPGGPYYVSPGGSPPPSAQDIYNSIPGVPKDKVTKVSHGFKIC